MTTSTTSHQQTITLAAAGRLLSDSIESITVKEAARLLDLSESKVHKLIASGELPSFKLGRARRIRLDAIRQIQA